MSISHIYTWLWLWLLLAHHHWLTIAAVDLLLLGLRCLAVVGESLSGDRHGLRCWHAVALNHWLLAWHRLSVSNSEGGRGHLRETTLRRLHHLLRLLLHHHLLRRWLLHHLSGCCLLLHHVLLRWLLGHLRLWLGCVIGLLHRLLLVRHHLLLDHRLAWGSWNFSQVHVVALDVVDMPAQARTESQN